MQTQNTSTPTMMDVLFDSYASCRSGEIICNLDRAPAYRELSAQFYGLIDVLDKNLPRECWSAVHSYKDALHSNRYEETETYYKVGFLLGALSLKDSWPSLMNRVVEKHFHESIIGSISGLSNLRRRNDDERQSTGQQFHSTLKKEGAVLFHEKIISAYAACLAYADKVCFKAGQYDGRKYPDIFDLSQISISPFQGKFLCVA